jgi:hypothetical protein
MFVCAITKKLSRPGIKPIKLVTLTRPKTYTETRRNEDTGLIETVQIGSGFEIVKEVDVSEEGLAIWNAAQAKEESSF